MRDEALRADFHPESGYFGSRDLKEATQVFQEATQVFQAMPLFQAMLEKPPEALRGFLESLVLGSKSGDADFSDSGDSEGHPESHAESRGRQSYPPRLPVPDAQVEWTVRWEAYKPSFVPAFRRGGRGQAADSGDSGDSGDVDPDDPQDVSMEEWAARKSHEGPLDFGEDYGPWQLRVPHNPRGRTGLAGRGALSRWGANEDLYVIIMRAANFKHCHQHSPEVLVRLEHSAEPDFWQSAGGPAWQPGEAVLALPGCPQQEGLVWPTVLENALCESAGFQPAPPCRPRAWVKASAH